MNRRCSVVVIGVAAALSLMGCSGEPEPASVTVTEAVSGCVDQVVEITGGALPFDAQDAAAVSTFAEAVGQCVVSFHAQDGAVCEPNAQTQHVVCTVAGQQQDVTAVVVQRIGQEPSA